MEKPIVLVSECLLGVPCRYDDTVISSLFVKKLCVYAEVISLCPEMRIGLPVPRPKIHLVRMPDGRMTIVQEGTGADLTTQLEEMSYQYVSSLPQIHGAIMKAKSPSCAFDDAKIYASGDFESVIDHGVGVFTKELRMQCPQLPIETEVTLADPSVRHAFLVHIFSHTNADGLYPKPLLHDDDIIV